MISTNQLQSLSLTVVGGKSVSSISISTRVLDVCDGDTMKEYSLSGREISISADLRREQVEDTEHESCKAGLQQESRLLPSAIH